MRIFLALMISTIALAVSGCGNSNCSTRYSDRYACAPVRQAVAEVTYTEPAYMPPVTPMPPAPPMPPVREPVFEPAFEPAPVAVCNPCAGF